MSRRSPSLVVLSLSLVLASPSHAAGGSYAIDGGTWREQEQVRAALQASTFDWSLVPARVSIHVRRGIATSYSTPGEIWLDADLLDSGRFSWGAVQMEYAHQVHFFLLDDAARARLTRLLGGDAWCFETPTTSPGANACERFAALLAWAYWPSPDNAMRPSGSGDWSARMSPSAFRAFLNPIVAGVTVTGIEP